MSEHKGLNTLKTNIIIVNLLLCLCTTTDGYLVIVHENATLGDVIFNASVYKLGSERQYKINAHKSASFVHRLLNVDNKNGEVKLRTTLKCDGLYYPSLFTFYVDSTSNRIRDIDYYSLPLRIFITGDDCSDSYFDLNNHLDDEIETEVTKMKRSIQNSSQNHRHLRDLHQNEGYLLDTTKNHVRRQEILRKKREIHFLANKITHNRILEAKQWISETFASFAIPTSDKWQKICLKRSQFVNSVTNFLPKTIHQYCKVTYVDLNDHRFTIETRNFDLVASDDVCITEPLWKVVILLKVKCEKVNIIDAEHRLKIVYHHQEFNDTDIAKRVRRELRNQSPYFDQVLYLASVLEEQDPPSAVVTLRARDPEGSAISYSMTSLLDSRSQSMFKIDPKQGIITTIAKLDRELVDVHYFKILATDDSFPPRSGTTTVQINVLDCNDHAPTFESNEFQTSIRETASVGTTVITVRATDQDVGKNAEIEYSIVSISGGGVDTVEEDQQAFRIDSHTGVVSIKTQLDRERVEVYTVILQASDCASPLSERKTSSASVLINVLDDNDNYPQFSERTYTVQVNEDAGGDNKVIARIQASDADSGVNAAIRYAIIGGNTQSQFAIDSMNGKVTLVKPLDYESTRSYRLVIRAQDGGSPSRSNTTQLLVSVVDVNDNSPRFYTQLFQEAVLESVPSGYNIVRVQAYDADEGENAEITYSIIDSDASITHSETDRGDFPLAVDSRTGWVHTIRGLDREIQSKYKFQIMAVDHGKPPHSATASVVVIVQDVNDNDPTFNPKYYEAALAEDEIPGTPVVQVTATDPDEDSRLHYEISAGNTRGRFAITSQNGRGLITVSQPLDYKQERRFILTVTATDSGGRIDTAAVNINITDANNFAPVFENAPYTASVFEDAPVGSTVLVVSATDGDVGLNAKITFSLADDPNGPQVFKINQHTGAITTSNLLDRETTSGYLLTVTAQDGGNPPLSDTTDIEISVTDVNDNKPLFSVPMYQASIAEDALIGTSVIQISATDQDIGLNGRIRYGLSLKDMEDGSFLIDPSSGVIRTNKGLDRESVAAYHLQAYAMDRGTPSLSSVVEVQIRIEDVNDNSPMFPSDRLTLYISENSPIGSLVGVLHAHDPDEGVNAIVHYSITGGDDSNSFSLVTRPGTDRAELLTMVDMDYESSKKRFELVVRAASPPLRNDVHVEVIVTDVNDNAPTLKDFQVIFNNFRDCFPSGPIGKIPAFDADVTDKLSYRILSGNNARLVKLNHTSGELTLSPQLNTNVPKIASMEVAVSDGVNEVKSIMSLTVRLVTEDMLFNSVTVRLNDMNSESFLSPLMSYFIDGLAAIIPCPRENIYLLSIQDDTDVSSRILNVSFSARRADTQSVAFYMPQHLQERVYLYRTLLQSISTVQVMPFDDNLCVREPCLNFEQCLTVLKFGNASGFIHSETVLFRPIYPVNTFACRCPDGFTGSREQYLCDTEVNLCYSNPCLNSGTCIRREGGYTCVCPFSYTGENCKTSLQTCTENDCMMQKNCLLNTVTDYSCEKCTRKTAHVLKSSNVDFTQTCELRTRSFVDGSYLTFPSLRQRHRLHIKLRFATLESNALLLYNGRYNNENDYVALEIINGAVQFSFSLGSDESYVSTSIIGGVSNGEWHTVLVDYFNKTAILSLDNCDKALALHDTSEHGVSVTCANKTSHELPQRCALLTETCHRFLDLTGPMQLGGLPDIPGRFQVKTHRYVGCISDLYIDNQYIDLNNFVADNDTVPGCPEKMPFCQSYPCVNGGTCIEKWSTFECTCLEGYTGRECQETGIPPWRFEGDGLLSFNPLLRPIQLPWLNALTVRTRQANAFLMSVQLGQNSSAMLSLKSGLLHYTYNNNPVHLSGLNISDGMWHRIEVVWLGTELSMSIDYGQRLKIFPMTYKIQGLYVGKIVLGMDAAYINNIDYGFFIGCIQDVRVGNTQSVLNRPTVQENVLEGCSSLAECTNDCPTNAQCFTEWDDSYCQCLDGYIGEMCIPVCAVNPCLNNAKCHPNVTQSKGYECICNSSLFSGEYCETALEQPCPAGWWGVGECGPCKCDVSQGYNADCNKTTGVCYCKENHYQPLDQEVCLPCDCYLTGSYSQLCDRETGQCSCRDGVIGRRCDTCPNPYAEITFQGCKVVYDSCPQALSCGLWWPRTSFGSISVITCPSPAIGKGSRLCDSTLGGWQEPDLFNCTSKPFIELRKQLSQLENKELALNTFVSIKLAGDLRKACSAFDENFEVKTQSMNPPSPLMMPQGFLRLYGADILVSEGILQFLIGYELEQSGLNLSHSQDKDFIQNIIQAASIILNIEYKSEWDRIAKFTGRNVDSLVRMLHRYITILAENQHDTYTSPFEITQHSVVLGLDIVTAESLFGYEPQQLNEYHMKPVTPYLNNTYTRSNLSKHQLRQHTSSYTTERVVLPDTSGFLLPVDSQKKRITKLISFPKYNNFMMHGNKFDKHTKVMIPLEVIGIKQPDTDEVTVKSLSNSRAVFSYVQYKYAGLLFPSKYDLTVSRRWGIELCVASPIISVTILIPSYVTISNKSKHENSYANSPNNEQWHDDQRQVKEHIKMTTGVNNKEDNLLNNIITTKVVNGYSKTDLNKKLDTESSTSKNDKKSKENVKEIENDSGYIHDDELMQPRVMALVLDNSESKLTSDAKLIYRPLNNIDLKQPIRLQIWLDLKALRYTGRSNPQCVHWRYTNGEGAWSRIGCQTEVSTDVINFNTRGLNLDMGNRPLLINCTCNELSTYAVLVDVIDPEDVPDPTLLQILLSCVCFGIALLLLATVLIALGLLRGPQTNSIRIHTNLVMCVFMAELLYFVGLQARKTLVDHEFPCKLIAMWLHYFWLSTFSWSVVDVMHLYRMLTEMRDINHGPMKVYYGLGYAGPAIITGLAVGVRAHEYGNTIFCWLSIFESVIWWLVAPICVTVFISLMVLFLSIKAAFTLKDHVLGFGNLRTLLWLSVVSLPLLVIIWVLALLASSDPDPSLEFVLNICVLTHAVFCLIGYCIINNRVKENIHRTILHCMGRKLPLLESSSSTSHIGGLHRTSLSYPGVPSGSGAPRRHIGISASSTTSRSTTKTSSSPYSRSDGQLRNTSTSNSTSDVPSYLKGYDSNLPRHKEEKTRKDSDSDSDSEGRSLDLASSHSSDDEESSNKRNRKKGTTAAHNYLPNITEVQSPPDLHVLNSPQLFPNVQPSPQYMKPIYAPKWSSHLPEAYLPTYNNGRWSQDTGSDNEIQPTLAHATLSHAHKTHSPNPLPNPDLTLDTNYTHKLNVRPTILENLQYGGDSHRQYDLLDSANYGRNLIESDCHDRNYECGSQALRYDKFRHSEGFGYEDIINPEQGQTIISPSLYSEQNVYGSQNVPFNSGQFEPKYNSREKTFGLSSPQFNDNQPQFVTFGNKENMFGQNITENYQNSALPIGYKASDYQQDICDQMSENSEKYNICDKYLFPYTAEEDHSSPPLTNDINNPGASGVGDYHSRMSSRMGSRGGSCRATPSPIPPSHLSGAYIHNFGGAAPALAPLTNITDTEEKTMDETSV